MVDPARTAEAPGLRPASQDMLWVHPRFEPLLVPGGAELARRLLDEPLPQLLTKPGLARWRLRGRLTVPDAEGRGHVFFIKRYVRPPRRAQRAALRDCGGASSLAGVEWTWMQRLAHDGIDCTQPAALAERIENGRELASALLTAQTPGVSLEQWLAQRTGDPAGPHLHAAEHPTRRRQVIESLADLILRFHARGYVHRDLYASHIFIDEAGAGARFRLIDLARVLRPRWLRTRWIVKDLAALHYSCPAAVVRAPDRIRWLKRYLGVRRLRPRDRRLIRRIERKAWRIARHDARRRAAQSTQPPERV